MRGFLCVVFGTQVDKSMPPEKSFLPEVMMITLYFILKRIDYHPKFHSLIDIVFIDFSLQSHFIMAMSSSIVLVKSVIGSAF